VGSGSFAPSALSGTERNRNEQFPESNTFRRKCAGWLARKCLQSGLLSEILVVARELAGMYRLNTLGMSRITAKRSTLRGRWASPSSRRSRAVRLLALETAGYSLLVPWDFAHASLLLAATCTAVDPGASSTPHDTEASPADTVVLFMFPVLAVTLGVAGLHMELWQDQVPRLLAALVLSASMCLVGSVIGSAATERRNVAAARGKTLVDAGSGNAREGFVISLRNVEKVVERAGARTSMLVRSLNDERSAIVQVTHSEKNAGCGTRVVRLPDGWIVDE
jgi:hypothetical protein